MNRSQYAGFWRRFVALIIDYNIVLVALFPFFLLGALFLPDRVVVEAPYGLFTETETLEISEHEEGHGDGSVTVIETTLVRKEVLGRWVYHYEMVQESIANEKETSQTMIDPVSREPAEVLNDDDVILYVLLLYWILMESSRWKATIGKRVMGIIVESIDGHQLSIPQSIGRNAAKLLSAMTLMIGFMMAGWTDRKQALHDKLAACYVLKK